MSILSRFNYVRVNFIVDYNNLNFTTIRSGEPNKFFIVLLNV